MDSASPGLQMDTPFCRGASTSEPTALTLTGFRKTICTLPLLSWRSSSQPDTPDLPFLRLPMLSCNVAARQFLLKWNHARKMSLFSFP